MSLAYEKRCCALQALFQADQGGVADFKVIAIAYERRANEVHDATKDSDHECDFSQEAVADGIDWAESAWAVRQEADTAVQAFAPEWPTHRQPNAADRQPTIDRNILRLGYWELKHANRPTALVIDSAVELAKEYGTDKSPAFINAVLDAIAKAPAGAADAPAPSK